MIILAASIVGENAHFRLYRCFLLWNSVVCLVNMSVTLDKCHVLEVSLYIQEMFGLYRPGMCFNLPNSRPYLFVCLNELGRNPFVL